MGTFSTRWGPQLLVLQPVDGQSTRTICNRLMYLCGNSWHLLSAPLEIWTGQPWHETLHLWHLKIDRALKASGLSVWSWNVLTQYWKLGSYVACLPEDRWARRVMNWIPQGTPALDLRAAHANNGTVNLSSCVRRRSSGIGVLLLRTQSHGFL